MSHDLWMNMGQNMDEYVQYHPSPIVPIDFGYFSHLLVDRTAARIDGMRMAQALPAALPIALLVLRHLAMGVFPHGNHGK